MGLTATAPLDLNIGVSQGRLETVVDGLGLTQVADLVPTPSTPIPKGRARDLGIITLPGPNRGLSAKLATYAQVSKQVAARTPTTTVGLIPQDFRQLQGQFQLQARLTGTTARPRVRFDLAGQDWRWQQYQLETLQARGNYRDGSLTLEESQAQYQERTGRLTGTLALNGAQDAQLEVQNLPLELINPLLPKTTRLTGDLSSQAQIRGTLRQPVVTAPVQVAALQVNGRDLDPVTTRVNLQAGRLALSQTQVGINRRGAVVVGSLPIPILNPSDPRLDLRVILPGADLPLLNLLSDQLVWQPAAGEASLTVGGTFADPQVDGVVSLQQAAVRVTRLGSDLVINNLNANLDRRVVRVADFNGSLGGAALTGQGEIPIRRPNLTVDNPLAVNVDGNIDLPRLYRGGIAGRLLFGGALTEPVLGGGLILNPGNLLLGLRDFQALAQGPTTTVRAINETTVASLPLSFRQFNIQLGPQFGVAVASLNARLDGSLALNGPLDKLQPTGQVTLPQGLLEIGSARFRIDPSRTNTLTFVGNTDPQLDIQAEASVSDFVGTGSFGGLQRTGLTNIPVQLPLGRYEKIQIQARVTGTASRPDIELRSSPPRDQVEILALIGGDLFNPAAQSSSLLTGLVPALSGQLLSPIERDLAALLGLDELNIGLASLVAPSGPTTFGLGVGVEAVKDLSPVLSLSASRNLTENALPALFGLRYRLSDKIVLRLNTTEQFDEQVLYFQYDTRF
ncbi:translocation/assembly module TamB domain-containing protein [Candidatus Cyanaurora vandensis]|uniref:translocation/assembly module TamB domain-containing protein n=1 Tax=Candidatus Cyanaurora vandensis TaxID=2714958 RepID=UPI00257D700A|nr:translocation/assembly module TamB domain-containing protein [Candidatus Cyanaurora vandensis]